MNYKNALVAVAATITLGLTPAFASANAKANPQINSSYWTTNVHYVTFKQSTKADKYKLIKQNNQTKLVKVKNASMNFKKGSQYYMQRVGNKWAFNFGNENNNTTLYQVNNTALNNSNSWFKLSKAKQLVTANSNYQTASNQDLSESNFTDGYVTLGSKSFTSNGVTIKPGQKYQVKLDYTGDQSNPKVNYQFKVGDKTITAPNSQSLIVAPYNVIYNSGNNNNGKKEAPYIASNYSPGSKKAVVPKDFKPTDGLQWIQTTDTSANKVSHYYSYNAKSNNWVRFHITSDKKIAYDYK